MQEWKGREILYPNDMHFFMQGRDTLNADSICMYKIITYIDLSYPDIGRHIYKLINVLLL